MEDRIAQCWNRERNLETQYNNHVNVFLKSFSDDAGKRQRHSVEIVQLACTLYAQRKQTDWLELIAAKSEVCRRDTVNDISDLGLEPVDVEAALADATVIRNKLAAGHDRLPSALRRCVEKQVDKMARVLVQFVDKRNVMRRCEANAVGHKRVESMLNELVLLKSNLVRSVAHIEKLCEPRKYMKECV